MAVEVERFPVTCIANAISLGIEVIGLPDSVSDEEDFLCKLRQGMVEQLPLEGYSVD